MNIDDIKKLVKHSTAVLVLDNGEPSFAILNYETYKDLVLGGKEKEIKISHTLVSGNSFSSKSNPGFSPEKPSLSENEMEILERINKDILALKNEIEKEEKMTGFDITSPDQLT